MELNLESLVQLIALIGFGCACVNYIIIKPFNDSLNRQSGSFDDTILRLSNAIAKLEKVVEKVEIKQHNIETRLIVVEQKANSAHHRIDEMKGSGN